MVAVIEVSVGLKTLLLDSDTAAMGHGVRHCTAALRLPLSAALISSPGTGLQYRATGINLSTSCVSVCVGGVCMGMGVCLCVFEMQRQYKCMSQSFRMDSQNH